MTDPEPLQNKIRPVTDVAADLQSTASGSSPDRRELLKKIGSVATLPAVSGAFIANDANDALAY